MKNLLNKEPAEVFDALLKRLPASSLKSFIEEEVTADASLIHRFIIRFAAETTLTAEEKYLLQYRNVVLLAHYNTHKFLSAIDYYLKRAEDLFASGNYLEAFFMASNLIREHPKFPPQMEIETEGLMQRSLNLLTEISGSDAGIDLKEKNFELLSEDALAASRNFASSEKTSWLNSLITIAGDENQLRRSLEIVNDFIGKNRGQFAATIDDSYEEQLLFLKLQLFEKLNLADEVHHLLEANSHLKIFRMKLIEECFVKNDLPQARLLIKEGRKLEEQKGKFSLSADWDLLLLRIAQQEKDVKAIRNLALQLFLSSEFNFDYLHLLKQHYDTSRWKLQLDRIVRFMKEQKSFATVGIHAVAKIYTEEKEWSRLLMLLQKNANMEFVDRYFNLLKEKFPEELLDIYRRAVRRYAEKNMGTDPYKKVVSTLGKMQALPGGRDIVQALAIELKVDYRQRKKFVAGLNKLPL